HWPETLKRRDASLMKGVQRSMRCRKVIAFSSANIDGPGGLGLGSGAGLACTILRGGFGATVRATGFVGCGADGGGADIRTAASTHSRRAPAPKAGACAFNRARRSAPVRAI